MLQIAAWVQAVALLDAVALHLVKQCPQTPSQPFGGGPPVAIAPFQSRCDGCALSGLDALSERTTPHTLLPSVGVGSGEWSLSEILGVQDLLVRQHRRALDRVLQLAHVAAPRLALQPAHGAGAEREGPPQP